MPILILPVNVVGLIPALLVYLFRGTRWAHATRPPTSPAFWLGLTLGAAGLATAVWTAWLFVRVGQGTPAPWDPPRRLVVRGPYRHVRNPMIGGVFLMLLAEAIVLQSWPIAGWLAAIVAANVAYIPLVEERRLRRRFGQAYQDYLANVPRWIPRLRPWRPDQAD